MQIYLKIKQHLMSAILACIFAITTASANQNSILPADKAFALTATPFTAGVMLNWNMPPGYHLYKSSIKITTPANSKLELDSINMPIGIAKQDKLLGNYSIYTNALKLIVPFTAGLPSKSGAILNISYQGCFKSTYCFPPIHKQINITTNSNLTISTITEPTAAPNTIKSLFANKNIFAIAASFLFFGILLAFTPCVLPMIPILSSIIIGQQNTSAKKAFVLSLIYVLSAALAFAVAGYITALAGHSVQEFLQNKWVIIFMAFVFIALALSLFGLYDLQLPNFIHEKITRASNKQSGGTYLGTAIMGALSSLIVSPCISAPLVGALVYISTTGDVIIGATALFALGLGMGIPLIVVGTFCGKYIIKAGSWMRSIKIIFGIIMLGLAAFMLTRLLPSKAATDGFTVVYNASELNQQLLRAEHENKPAIVDYYATWCRACKELEHKTLNNSGVRQKLKNFVLIRADVSKNNSNTKKMQQRFGVFAPPTIIFISANGKTLHANTIYGFVNAKKFTRSIDNAIAAR